MKTLNPEKTIEFLNWVSHSKEYENFDLQDRKRWIEHQIENFLEKNNIDPNEEILEFSNFLQNYKYKRLTQKKEYTYWAELHFDCGVVDHYGKWYKQIILSKRNGKIYAVKNPTQGFSRDNLPLKFTMTKLFERLIQFMINNNIIWLYEEPYELKNLHF